MDRTSKLLTGIDLETQHGIEIGPLCTPVIRHPNVKYVDRLSTDGLKKQYSDDGNVNNDTICHVDYVWSIEGWNDPTLAELFPDKINFAIASHVIEHTPNMVGWLLDIRSVLNVGGILSLAVPDKRYTFDYLRALSTVEQFIEAYICNFRRASPRMIFDYYNNVVTLDGKTSISNREVAPRIVTKIYTPRDALKNAKESTVSDTFFDTHNWVFTRESFLEIIGELSFLGLFPYTVKENFNVDGCEFIIILEAE